MFSYLEPFINLTIFFTFFLFFVLLAIFLISILYYWYRHKLFLNQSFASAKDLVFFKVRVPENNEVEVKSFEQFYNTLLGTKELKRFDINKSPHISLEIVGDEHGINFYVSSPKNIESLVEKAIHSVYSDAEIVKGDKNIWNIWERDGKQDFKEFYLSKEDYYPLKTYEEGEIDVLSSILSVMSKMGEGEAIALQLLIRPSSSLWKDMGSSKANYMLNKKDKDGNPKSTDKDREKAEVIKSKTKYEGFEAVIRVLSVAPSEDTAKQNIKNMQNSLATLNNPAGNKIKSKPFRKYPLFINEKNNFVYSFIFRVFPYFHIVLPYFNKQVVKGVSVFSTKELATIYHFPNKNIKTPGINWLRSRESFTPSNIPESGLYLGISDYRGVEKKVHIKEDDRRRHLYIVGQTGTGKSELMKQLAVQDIRNGKGLAFIDPHGSAIADLLLQVPKERIDDVIYFNPGDEEFPMGFNILDVQGDKARNMVVNGFIDLLYKLYDPGHTGIVGPQLERAVRNSMLSIMEVVPGGTMVDVLRLVIDQKYEKEIASKVQDPIVKKYWTDEMANTQAFHRSEKTGYFVSKFDRFVTEKVMRNIMGQSKSAFDLHEVMHNKKILFIDLSKGLLGEENSKFLGLLLIPRILSAAFARPNLHKEFDDFYLYVDEFQNFATPDFVTILSEARKYKLNLTVANQFLSQMEEPIRNAVFGNVGTLVSFRVGQDDAKYLSEQLQPSFNDTDLLNLQVGKFAIRLLVDGFPTQPFSMTADWNANMSAPRSEEIKQQIIENSRRKYGRPAKEVEAEVNAKMLPVEEEAPKTPMGNPMGMGANPFAGAGFANPFAPRPLTPSGAGQALTPPQPQPDVPFSSGKTPFSQQPPQPVQPFNPFMPRPLTPFGAGQAPSPFGAGQAPSPFGAGQAPSPFGAGQAPLPYGTGQAMSPFPPTGQPLNGLTGQPTSPYPVNPFANTFRPPVMPVSPMGQMSPMGSMNSYPQPANPQTSQPVNPMNPYPVNPFANMFRPAMPVSPMGQMSPMGSMNPYPQPANPQTSQSVNPLKPFVSISGTQPANQQTSQPVNSSHHRGAVSLADFKKDIKTFDKTTTPPPPRPSFNGPVSTQGEENKPKEPDATNPLNSKIL